MSTQSGREILTLPPPPYDRKIAYGPDPFHFGYLRLPKSKGPHPVVVVIHGGFWRAAFDLEHSGHLCQALTSAGMATWSLEYRRIGHPGGGWPGTCQDVLLGASQVASFAPQYGLDASRMLAIGHSAGGHLALWLASKMRLRGVVSLAGVADLRRAYELKLSNTVVRDFMGGASPDEAPDEYRKASPIEHLPLKIPVRLIHGDADDVVPIEISQRYEAAALEAGGQSTKLVTLPGANHFPVIDPRSKEWPIVERAVLELL
jgi:dipeptidyl aminopeptidase/acylaminoacyl peptidase